MRTRSIHIILTLVFIISITGITMARTECQMGNKAVENCCSNGNTNDCCIEKISYLKNNTNQERPQNNSIALDIPGLSLLYINFVNDLFSSTEKSHIRLYNKLPLTRDIPILISCFRL